MKRDFRIQAILFSISLLHFACSDSLESDTANDVLKDDVSYPGMHIVNADKLTIPVEKTEEVWQFLHQNFVEETEKLMSFDVSLQSSFGEELFTNTYFDTPELALHAIQSSVRHRQRTKISETGQNKNIKENVLIKSSRLSSVVLPSGEVKFGVAYHQKLKSLEDKHPTIGLVKRSKRDKFKKTLESLNIDASDLQPVLTSQIRRRSIEIVYHNSPFLSISLDEVSSEKLWAKTNFAELVLEFDETTYSEADELAREYMQDIAAKITQTIREQFPDLQPAPTSKYNKAFDALAEKIPAFAFLVKHGLI